MSDLISRQAVLMSLADYQLQESPNWGANGMGNTDAYEAITECIRVIEQAPTIDQVKHGKWIERERYRTTKDGVFHTYRYKVCSICGRASGRRMNKRTRYCPNCGARME